MEITIIYGTETGNSESLAREAREKLTKLGHQATVVDMEDMTVEQLKMWNAGRHQHGETENLPPMQRRYQALKDSRRPFHSQLCRLCPWG